MSSRQHITVCAVVSAVALLFCIWGAIHGCALLQNLGVLHGMAAISIGSMWFGRDSLLTGASRSVTDAGVSTLQTPTAQEFVAPWQLLLVAGWVACFLWAVLSFFYDLTEPESIGSHRGLDVLTIFAASVWFILSRTAQATSTNVPTPRLSNSADIVVVLKELCTLSLIVAGAFLFGDVTPSAVKLAEFGVRLWTVGWGTVGLLHGIAEFLDGKSMLVGIATSSICSRAISQGTASENHSDGGESSPQRNCKSTCPLRFSKFGMFQLLWCVCAAGWVLTGIVVVQPTERAVYFRLGRIQQQPLDPGLHFTLPKPFGRVDYIPVFPIRMQAAGFTAEPRVLLQTPLLWTRAHGNMELPFIIGNGTELVAVNALLQYRISVESDALRRYVLSFAFPEQFLPPLVRRVLTTETRSCTLEDLLTEGRDAWQNRVNARLRAEVKKHSEAIDIIDLNILSVHPPVEVAPSYLELVSARIDADRLVLESRGAATTELLQSRMMAQTFVADAKVGAADRLIAVVDESSQMESLATVFTRFPEVVRQRAVCDVLSRALEGKPLTLIDATIPPDTQLWIGDGPRSARETHPASESRSGVR